MKKKFLGIIIIFVILGLAVCQVVNALSFTPIMTPSSSVVQEETEFTVTIKVSNLDAGNGINKFVSELEYDTTVFDEINESCIDGLNKWVPQYDSTTKKITLTKDTFVSSSQEILKITFKTKSGTYGKTGTITLKNVKASSSENDIDAQNISTTISIGVDSNANNTVNNITTITPNTNKVTNNTVNNVVNNVINNTTKNTTNNTISSYVNTTKNTTVTNETVPYTGVDDTIIGVIVAVIALALIFYFKIEKINEELK